MIIPHKAPDKPHNNSLLFVDAKESKATIVNIMADKAEIKLIIFINYQINIDKNILIV